MMHVLVIPGAYPGRHSAYAGIFFKTITEAIAEQGIKVGVIAPEILPFNATLNIKNWPLFGNSYVTYSAHGVPIYRKVGMNITPLNRKFNEYIFVKYALLLYRAYIEKHGIPDVIHAHTTLWAGLAAFEIKKKYNIPYIITEHSSAFLKDSHRNHDEQLNEIIFKNASSRIAVSTALIEAIQRKHSYPFCLIPNLIDTNNYQLRDANNQPYKLITVGSLLNVKGYSYLLGALKKCSERIPEIHLTIVGDGPERKHLSRLTEQLNLRNHVSFVGSKTPLEVAELLKNHSIFVSSSLFETFGVAIIEALASGLPVVATNCGGPLDILDESNGKICKKANIDSLFEAILYVYTNYSRYLPENIRRSTEQKFGKDAVTIQMLNVYNEVVK